MPPIIPQVDHESRHYSDNDGEQMSEASPLLPRFSPQLTRIGHKNTLVISLLLIILLAGIIIGIYLLVIQSNSENVLPPIDVPPLQLISRAQWDPLSGYARARLTMTPLRAKYVIIVQTDTRECDCLLSCIKLINEIKVNGTNGFYDIQYNFLVAEDGETFEGLGWKQASPLFAAHDSDAIVIAVIGNYTHVPPTRLQLQQTQNLIVKSLSLQRLDPNYKVFAKSVKYYAKHLVIAYKQIPHWDSDLTDKPN